MIRIILSIVIGLILTFKLEAKKIEGKILFENDTIDVTFNIPIKMFKQEPNYEKLQYKVKYFDSTGKKLTLRPDNAKEIQFKNENENVRMLSRYNSLRSGKFLLMSSNIFLKLLTDGELKLFNFYYTQSSPDMYDASTGDMTGGNSINLERFVLQKGEGDLKRPKGLTFKKDMADYFSDCPALIEKIESKDFRKNDLEFVVRFYNSNCGK